VARAEIEERVRLVAREVRRERLRKRFVGELGVGRRGVDGDAAVRGESEREADAGSRHGGGR
jgi:hypothetical protein